MAILRADDDGAVLRVLLGVIAVDEVDAEEGLSTVGSAYARLTGRTLAAELDEDGKQTLFAAAFEVAVADGFVLDDEDRLLSTLAAALGMNELDYRACVEKLMPR